MIALRKHDEDGKITRSVEIVSVRQFAEELIQSGYGTWIEGIGEPSNRSDIQMWQDTGRAIYKLAKE